MDFLQEGPRNMQNFITSLGRSQEHQKLKFACSQGSQDFIPRTVLEKVSCFDTPRTAWYKRGRLEKYQIQTCLSQSASLFLYKKQNYKLVSRKLTKRQVATIQTCLPLLLQTPQSGLYQLESLAVGQLLVFKKKTFFDTCNLADPWLDLASTFNQDHHGRVVEVPQASMVPYPLKPYGLGHHMLWLVVGISMVPQVKVPQVIRYLRFCMVP